MARILCVDDDANAVVLKKTILEEAGHTVESCDSVDDAVSELDAVERFASDQSALGEDGSLYGLFRMNDETGHCLTELSGHTASRLAG